MIDLRKRILRPRILGPDSAQRDVNLFDYIVSAQTEVGEPILIGRWGTGKTAILISRCNELLEYFGKDAEEHFRNSNICLIEENDINAIMVSDELIRAGRTEVERRFIFEAMWQIEILRRVVLMLVLIKKKEGRRLSGDHWATITRDNGLNTIVSNVWNSAEIIGSITKAVAGIDINASKTLAEIREFYSSSRYEAINECISDLIYQGLPIPIVCVEPIETPLAKIEKRRSLANELIAALLNTWYRNFSDDRPGNLISVHLSVPWHRFDLSEINMPQKIQEFCYTVSWRRKNFRELIENRLIWHMKQCKTRAFRASEWDDPWHTFFPEYIENSSNFDGGIKKEKSFDYVCRHCSWRSRDFIRIVRSCLKENCGNSTKKTWDFFDTGAKIAEQSIRDGVARQAYQISKEKLIEAHTKFSNFEVFERQDYLDSVMRRVKSPMSQDEFAEVIGDRVVEVSGTFLDEFLNRLWQSEIIGLAMETSTKSGEYRDFVKRYVSIANDELYDIEMGTGVLEGTDRVGFLFSYSSGQDRSYSQLVREFPNALVVVNPVFNEFFGIQVSCPYPIGR